MSEDNEQVPDEEAEPIVAWGIEVVHADDGRKSVMHSAQKIVLTHELIKIQLPDGKVIAYQLSEVRKVLAMRTRQMEQLIEASRGADETA